MPRGSRPGVGREKPVQKNCGWRKRSKSGDFLKGFFLSQHRSVTAWLKSLEQNGYENGLWVAKWPGQALLPQATCLDCRSRFLARPGSRPSVFTPGHGVKSRMFRGSLANHVWGGEITGRAGPDGFGTGETTLCEVAESCAVQAPCPCLIFEEGGSFQNTGTNHPFMVFGSPKNPTGLSSVSSEEQCESASVA